ncbi:MAG: GAF domain-containing protein, partial [Pseudonocardia sp.]|nr:GAF domain-containing protein [Pseudonocardia sp.]
LVARGAPEAEIFDAVAAEAAHLIDDEPTTLVRYEGGRTFTVLAHRNGPAPVGTRFTVPANDAGTLDTMLSTLKPARLDHYDRIADRSFSKREFGVGSSVSVPILVQGRLWGSLGTLNEGRRLPAETESRLTKFVELVAAAIGNVAARAELERFGGEQAALRRVAEVVASAAPQEVVLRAVVTEAARLFADEVTVSVVRHGPADAWTTLEVGGPPAGAPGRPAAANAVARQVHTTGQAARIDDAAAPSDADGAAERAAVAAVGAPVQVYGRTWAVLVACGAPRDLPPETEDRLTQFAQIASTAVIGHQSRAALRRLATQQAALRRVAELIARGAALEEVFAAVATETSHLLGELAANLFRYDGDVVTAVATCRSPVPVGLQAPAGGDTVAGDMARARRPLRYTTLADTGSAGVAQDFDVEAMVAVPIFVEGCR